MEKVEREKLGVSGINADNPGCLFTLFIVVEHFYAQAPFYAQPVGVSVS